MKSIRFGASIVVLALLAAGYLGSQYAYFTGEAPQWAARMDQSPIVLLSLLVLLGSIAMAFVKEKT